MDMEKCDLFGSLVLIVTITQVIDIFQAEIDTIIVVKLYLKVKGSVVNPFEI